MLKVAASIPVRGGTVLLCARRSSGGTAHEGAGATCQFDLQSLTPLSVAGCGRLELGVCHWATSVALLQVGDNLPIRFSSGGLFREDFTLPFLVEFKKIIVNIFCKIYSLLQKINSNNNINNNYYYKFISIYIFQYL